MKQVLQFPKEPHPRVAEVPSPLIKGRGVLVRNRASLISSGTERTIIEMNRRSVVERARTTPNVMQKVMDKVRKDGLGATINKVLGKDAAPTALGYSCAGVVEHVHAAVDRFSLGDRVACAGFGYASHAEYVFVPVNLTANIPEGVTFDQASFVTLGAVALQGVRQADLRLGERVAVLGLGILGQLSCLLAIASGCQVIGLDIDAARVAFAKTAGIDDAFAIDTNTKERILDATAGHGVDAVIITAATTSAEPVALAGEICRERGTVVIVGAVKIDVPRETYYLKELQLKLSRSYGPGRYDYFYEEAGQDYPYAYVRWTENRNMQGFLQLIADKRVNIDPLITHRYTIEQAQEAYQRIDASHSGELVMGVILNYAEPVAPAKPILPTTKVVKPGEVGVGFVGAGSFATSVLLPAIADTKAFRLESILSGSGVTAATQAERRQFGGTAHTYDEILHSPDVDAVFIATRHDQHAALASQALLAGKAVFVEKPLAINSEQLLAVRDAYTKAGKPLMIGFNRRFAPFVQLLEQQLADRAHPLSIYYRINAGLIPSGHWIQDEEVGGGRIVGEICHFVDLLMFLSGGSITRVFAESLAMPDERFRADDNLQIMLRFSDGSVGTISYVASGSTLEPKEYLEILGGGMVARLEDFRSLHLVGPGKRKLERTASQDKGHRQMIAAWAEALVNSRPSPIPFEQITSVTQTTFDILACLEDGQPRSYSS